MYASDYGIEIVGSLSRPDRVIVTWLSFDRLKTFAAFGGVHLGHLEIEPVEAVTKDGAFYFLSPSDYELMVDALPDPEILYHSSDPRESYHSAGWTYFAYGTLFDDGTFGVHQGAIMRRDDVQSLDPSTRWLRKQLVDEGVAPDGVKFSRFYLFDSPAVAARVITGYRRVSNLWINQTGSRLKA